MKIAELKLLAEQFRCAPGDTDEHKFAIATLRLIETHEMMRQTLREDLGVCSERYANHYAPYLREALAKVDEEWG